MELMDYLVVGYLIILFLVTTYFRRYQDNKLILYLSNSLLYAACISTLGFFAFFYLVNNHVNYYYLYLIGSLLIIGIATLVAFLLTKYEKKNDTKSN